MKKRMSIFAVAVSVCLSGCSVANGLYEATFPGVNFDPNDYQRLTFDLATSPSAADRNRYEKFQFDAVYYGVAVDVDRSAVVANRINIRLCEDRSMTICTNRAVVSDLQYDEISKMARGTAVTFYGMVGEIEAVENGNIRIDNIDGSMRVFFLTTHQLLPRGATTAAIEGQQVSSNPSTRSPSNVLTTRDAQQILARLGYNVGSIDGVIGPRTATAIRTFQRNRGLPQTGTLDAATSDALSSSN
jgi:hypothetical protein